MGKNSMNSDDWQGSDLSVDTISVNKIKYKDAGSITVYSDLIPASHDTFSLGTITTRWDTLHVADIEALDIITTDIDAFDIDTVTITTNSGTTDNFTVDRLIGKNSSTVNLQGSLIPTSTDVFDIGSSSLRFSNTHNGNNYQLASSLSTPFTAPAISSGGGVTATVLISITNPSFNGGGNAFMFPQKGYYILSFNADWNNIGLLVNQLEIFLYRSSTGTTITTQTEDCIDTYRPRMFTFGIWIDNLADRYQIRIRGASGTSNFTISNGNLILCSKYV
jgi:hypothetical protein